MAGLEQFELPHNPESQHQLHWTPGSYGKGLVTPDGILHHWNTGGDFYDGDPTHRRYLMEKGVGDIYQNGKRDDYSLFWINPDGEHEILNGPHDERISQIDPRLRPTESQWHLADAGRQPWVDQAMKEKELWDTELRHDYRDVTEWVPTHELKKFMEYDRRPGQPDAHSSPERWNALHNHIRQNGFANAIVLDFNPDTGMAHMSEGNHRTQVALEAGIPHMPVRVYRSRRTSPTQIPVNPQPQDQWLNHVGDYHWPADIRPSHIGLPTVPAPDDRGASNWNLSKTASAIDIVLGESPPEDSAWSVLGRPDAYMPALYAEKDGPKVYLGRGGTHHADLVHEFHLPNNSINDWALIDTDGFHSQSTTFPQEAMEVLKEYVTHHHGTEFEDQPDGWIF